MAHAVNSLRNDEAAIVVPCFNEAERFESDAFCDFLQRSSDVTLVFVDDGSTDDTPLVLERLRQRFPRQIHTLRLNANVGKAEAVRRGVNAALRRQPATVGYWDADLATPLATIEQFRQVLRGRPELLLVMGSRVKLLGRQIERNSVRHFLGRTFATAASLVLRLPVYDTQCGAKLFRVTPQTAALFHRPFDARWIFDVEILARMIGSSVLNDRPAHELMYEYPLERWEDVAGSRLAARDFLVAARDLAAIYWRHTRHSATPSISDKSGNHRPQTEPSRREAA